VLEKVEIAWPNQAMWTRGHAAASVVPTYHHPKEGPSLQAHSPPRRRSRQVKTLPQQYVGIPPAINTSAAPVIHTQNTAACNRVDDIGWSQNGVAYPNCGNDLFSDDAVYNAWLLCMNSVTDSTASEHKPGFQPQRWQGGLDPTMAGSPSSSGTTNTPRPNGGSAMLAHATASSEESTGLCSMVTPSQEDSYMIGDDVPVSQARAPTNTPNSGHDSDGQSNINLMMRLNGDNKAKHTDDCQTCLRLCRRTACSQQILP
jgi:hypothetical protein